MASAARAFQHRNYRLFFAGQSISLIGTWMTRIATGWLVYRLTGSAFLLGLTGFCGQIPGLALAPVAGVLIDRWDRHRILIVTQALAMVQSAALATLTLSGVITIPHVLALQAFQGLINAFDTPARQAFVVHLVDDRRDLSNAIALNSSMVNVSRIAGPSIAGLLVGAVGEGWCFAIDALSYVAVIVSLLAMRVTLPGQTARQMQVLLELRSGFRYVAGSRALRMPLLLLAVVSATGIPYTVLMPVMANDVLHGGPNVYAALMTATGFGSLAGALYLASRHSVVGLGRIIGVATVTFGLTVGVFAVSRTLWVSLAVLPLVGAGSMMQMAATNTILQTVVAEEFRGRVMAYYTMAIVGTAPLGSLAAGVIAEWISVPMTILMGGAICLAAGIVFSLQLPKLRRAMLPIDQGRGMIPDSAADASADAVAAVTTLR